MNDETRTPPDALNTLRAVTARIAPVWPLDQFVAVNPYLGLRGLAFSDAAALLQKVSGARSTMSEADYRALLRRGAFEDEDIDRAISEAGSTRTRKEILRVLEAADPSPNAPEVITVADVLRETTGFDWSRFTVDHLGSFFAAHFDTGYAAWQPPRAASLFAAWKAEAEIDRTPEIMGARGFRKVIAALPESFEDAASAAFARLEIPEAGRELYLHRLLMRLGGWAAYAARVVWERNLRDGADDDTLLELATVLLCFELGLRESVGARRARAPWRVACDRNAALLEPAFRDGRAEARALLQRAYEGAFQRELIASFDRSGARSERHSFVGAKKRERPRPNAQAVFCIDVRSEVYRRHLEATVDDVETLGFAGFFGFPVEHVPIGHDRGSAQCPVLLAPSHRVRERCGSEEQTAHAIERRVERHMIERAWRSFKMGAISCFSFVGPVGLAYLPKLFTDALGLTRPVPEPADEGLGRLAGERSVDVTEELIGGRRVGIPLANQIDLAAGALRGMSLTGDFARLVVLTGHGSTSVNNPHASGLDCGACGGRSGEPNVRVAVEILNDADVRRGLKRRGIDIPDDTVFVAAQHDTTTDEVTVFSPGQVPPSHRAELERLEHGFAAAAETCRRERALRVRGAHDDAAKEWRRRSRDWAQVRPEWGLAGCAAFVAAPRSRTSGLDLGGRAFLHSYDWERDDGFSVLELIMTAPMVVASWINLQYYGSTVDPDVFGAGNKTLHNVVGGDLGVLEGNTGDLRVGLPWQSVHDGDTRQHEPIRLNVVIEAPIEAMNAVIEKHEAVRQLLDNGWIYLFAMDDAGKIHQRYDADLRWTPVDGSEANEEDEQAYSRAS